MLLLVVLFYNDYKVCNKSNIHFGNKDNDLQKCLPKFVQKCGMFQI